MARSPKPWFREERNAWFVTIRGERHNLGPDKADADRRFHELMAKKPEPVQEKPRGVLTVAEILDKYLDWCKKHRAERTYDWYFDHFQGFLNSLKNPHMAVTELKPFHVIEWTDHHPDWSPTFRRGAIIGLQRPFNWAVDLGYIDTSPIKRIAKPAPQRRENPMTPDDFALLISKIKPTDPFHDLLSFAWHSGVRPQEARHIEPRHVHLASECIIFPKEESKGKKRPRIIMLHGAALEIIKRLMEKRTQGKLFLNKRSKPWKKYAICNRMSRLAKKTGKKLALYDAPVTALPRGCSKAGRTTWPWPNCSAIPTARW